MATRVGIELLPHVCRIVEVREPMALPGRKPVRGRGTRVVAFREVLHTANSPGKLVADLKLLLKKRRSLARNVTVIAWGLKANHQVLLLPPAMPEELEELVRREAKSASGPAPTAARSGAGGARSSALYASRTVPGAKAAAPKQTTWADGFVAGEQREGGRQEVGYVSTTADEVRARLKQLADAGFEINTLLTPALSHAAIVRQRRLVSPDAVHAVVAFNPHATAITVLRGQVVLFTRELPWGWEPDQPGATLVPGDVSAAVERLSAELKRSFIFIKQQRHVDVGQVLVCGDMPDLRTLTGPLMAELNVEVEPLDSIEGIDAANLPAPAEEFRLNVARFRPACAAASESEPPINLMPRSSSVQVSVPPSTQRRIAVACVLSVALAAAGYYGANQMQTTVRAEAQRIRQRLAQLEPETQRQEQIDQAEKARGIRMAAVEALSTPGPRLALVLDAFRRAPSDLAASSMTVMSSPAGTWSMDVDGQARSATTPDAQAAFSVFLRALTASPFLGPPTHSPVIRVHIEEPPPPRPKQVTNTAAPTEYNATPPPVDLRDIPPTELPRGVDIVSAKWVRLYQGCEFFGWRRKYTVAIPKNYRNTGFVNRGWWPGNVYGGGYGNAWSAPGVAGVNGVGLARPWLGDDWAARIKAYNAPWPDEIPCKGGKKVEVRPTRSTAQAEAEAEPPPPFVGTVLDFVLHFEVRK